MFIVFYNLSMYLNVGESDKITIPYDLTTTTAEIRNLYPYKNYTFTLLVENDQGNNSGTQDTVQTAEWSEFS